MGGFNIGDVVVLKSGGPQMTIADFNDDGYVICTWFVDQKVSREAFIPATLEKDD
ncbi:YodC family protein [Providencia rettgeri]